MRTLAFDTTGPILTVGAAQDSRLMGRIDIRAERGRGNLLDQIVDDLLKEIDWTRKDVEGLGLLIGPGSLTASRLGWATAAGWGQAAGIPVTGWTVPAAHRRRLQDAALDAVCCIHYRGDTYLLYDLKRPAASPTPAHLTADAYSASPPTLLTGPGVIGNRESWTAYCGPQTQIVPEAEAIVGGDLLAVWTAEDLTRGEQLSLSSSPLEYGLPPDFKRLPST